MRILVVDDERETREFFQRALPAPKFEVVAVASGEAAVEATKHTPFYMAFVDIIMPGMDGLETLKALLAAQPQLPVVMMTGYAVEDNLILALHFGAVDFLYKPFTDPSDVLIAIERLRKRQQLKPLSSR